MKTATKKITLALVGAGGIGKVWAEAFKKSRNVATTIVVDRDKRKAREFARHFKGCMASVDWRTAVREKSVQAVVVATPHRWLAPISHAALAAGKHVLCEKPAGINSREVKKNVLLAARKRRVYMFGSIHRYHPGFIMAKKFFDQGYMGKVLFIRARHGFGGRAYYNKEWRFKKTISGGGELIDQGVHMIDLSRWFMGEFRDVKGFTENLYWGGGVEDNAFLLLRTKDRRVASIHVSWTDWEWIHSFEIIGDKGYCIIDGLDQRYRGPETITIGVCHPTRKNPPKERKVVFKNERKVNSFNRELAAFVAAIRGKGKAIPTGKDGYEILKVVERVYKQR